ncbi:unnamed protein product, partial [Owenia fusiformis]
TSRYVGLITLLFMDKSGAMFPSVCLRLELLTECTTTLTPTAVSMTTGSPFIPSSVAITTTTDTTTNYVDMTTTTELPTTSPATTATPDMTETHSEISTGSSTEKSLGTTVPSEITIHTSTDTTDTTEPDEGLINTSTDTMVTNEEVFVCDNRRTLECTTDLQDRSNMSAMCKLVLLNNMANITDCVNDRISTCPPEEQTRLEAHVLQQTNNLTTECNSTCPHYIHKAETFPQCYMNIIEKLDKFNDNDEKLVQFCREYTLMKICADAKLFNCPLLQEDHDRYVKPVKDILGPTCKGSTLYPALLEWSLLLIIQVTMTTVQTSTPII